MLNHSGIGFKGHITKQQKLTFCYCDYKNVNNQGHEKVHFHFIQRLVFNHVGEADNGYQPHDSVAGPFQKLAVVFKAADLHEVKQEGDKFLSQRHIALENLLQEHWNDSLLAFESCIGVDLLINAENLFIDVD